MSDLIKVTHLKRETFKTMAAKQKLDHYGNWLKDQEFKDMTAAVQIRDDRDTMERLKPPMQEAFGENEVCILQVECNRANIHSFLVLNVKFYVLHDRHISRPASLRVLYPFEQFLLLGTMVTLQRSLPNW
jgi:hypothetical protein